MLGITSIDPERNDLLFERFVSAERDEPPDIDVDFEHERREEVIQYIYDRYGRDRAGMVNEFICYRGRSSIRDVGKVFADGPGRRIKATDVTLDPKKETKLKRLTIPIAPRIQKADEYPR